MINKSFPEPFSEPRPEILLASPAVVVLLVLPACSPSVVPPSLSSLPMIVPAAKLLAFLIPGQPVVLRDPGRNLLDSALPYEEAWRMSVQGIVEGKVIGSRLRYLRLLSDTEVELRRKWELNSRSPITEGDKGRSTIIAHTNLGCYQEPLREVKMSSDIFGMRHVAYEGDFTFKCWSHIQK